MNTVHYASGAALIIYGIVKIAIGLCIMFVPYKYIEKNGLLTKYISDDPTFSGRFIHYVLIAYGLFTWAHGLAMIRNIEFKKEWIHIVNSTIGIILTAYYYLVLYTNAALPKAAKYRTNYMHDLLVGLTFLLFVPAWMIYDAVKPATKSYAIRIVLGLALLYVAITSIEKVLQIKIDKWTLITLPLNTL
jgi:hypothetical protein